MLGVQPTTTQTLLLQAVLNEGDAVIKAWQLWQNQVDIQTLEPASQRLLPLLYHKLKQCQVKDSLMSIYKGIHHHTWYKNQLALPQMLSIIKALQIKDIPTIALKGVALALYYYPEPGLRPMSDFDIMVPTKDAANAISTLESLGWQGKLRAPHSQNFVKALSECDLHWHLMLAGCELKAEQDFWEMAQPVNYRGVEFKLLSPTDLLFHVCVHGAAWSMFSRLSWIVDAMTILRQVKEIDWPRLVSQAEKRQVVLSLANSLDYLRTNFAAPIPTKVVTQLQTIPVGRAEKWDYLASICPTDKRSPLMAFWVCYREYRQDASSQDLLPSLAGFVKFLQARWQVKEITRLPLQIVEEIRKRS